jgi:hypothetical protein
MAIALFLSLAKCCPATQSVVGHFIIAPIATLHPLQRECCASRATAARWKHITSPSGIMAAEIRDLLVRNAAVPTASPRYEMRSTGTPTDQPLPTRQSATGCDVGTGGFVKIGRKLMPDRLPTIWSVFAEGEHFDSDVLFMNQKCIALGWPLAGDLSKLPATREAFKRHLSDIYKPYGNLTDDRIRSGSGALYKFLCEINVGDVVVYRSTYDEQLFIGEITGEYEFDAQEELAHPNARHRRAVTWYQPRGYFSDIAQKAASVRQSLRQITDKATVQEFLKALKKAKAAQPADSQRTS